MQLILSVSLQPTKLESRLNYPLVKVDGVLASHDIGNRRALGLAGLLGGRHSVKADRGKPIF